MSQRYPWYDSWWLASYVAARELICERFPKCELEFVDAFAPLRTDSGFRTVELPAVLGPERLADLRELIAGLTEDMLEKHEFFQFGRHVVHDHALLDDVQAEVTELVSRHAGERVVASYNFLSLYNNLGVCEPHMDAPNAKWTLDVCVDQSVPWPIRISEPCEWPLEMDASEGWQSRLKSDPAVRFHEHRHVEGSGLLFSGSSQWHYRDRISRGGQKNFSHLAFFHFVPTGTRELVDPRKWAGLFGIPEIAEVVVRPRSTG